MMWHPSGSPVSERALAQQDRDEEPVSLRDDNCNDIQTTGPEPNDSPRSRLSSPHPFDITLSMLYRPEYPTLYWTGTHTDPEDLIFLSTRDPIDIIDQDSGQHLMDSVPKAMLLHFCDRHAIIKYQKPGEDDIITLQIPNGLAMKKGLEIVTKYMQDWCATSDGKTLAHPPSGELRVPRDVQIGIQTAKACVALELFDEAERVQDFVVQEVIGKRLATPEDVYYVWTTDVAQTYKDAIIWHIIHNYVNQIAPAMGSLDILLLQPGLETLRVRIDEEKEDWRWREETLDEFLRRQEEVRQEKVEQEELRLEELREEELGQEEAAYQETEDQAADRATVPKARAASI